MTRDEMILAWQDAQQRLEVAREVERERRDALFSEAFPGAEVGTNTIELGGGYKLKAVRKQNYRLGKPGDVEDAVEKMSTLSAEGAFLAGRVFKRKYDISTAEYKKLPDELQKIVDGVLTITEGAPTLELVAPKAKPVAA